MILHVATTHVFLFITSLTVFCAAPAIVLNMFCSPRHLSGLVMPYFLLSDPLHTAGAG